MEETRLARRSSRRKIFIVDLSLDEGLCTELVRSVCLWSARVWEGGRKQSIQRKRRIYSGLLGILIVKMSDCKASLGSYYPALV